MKKLITLGLTLVFAVATVGCGGAGGSEGDENDPETTSDAEQMDDETMEEDPAKDREE